MEENRNEVFENNVNEQQTYSQTVVSETSAGVPAPKKKNVAILVLQIITAIIYLGITAFLVATLIDMLNTPPNPENSIDTTGLSLALYLIIFIPFGGIGYVINEVVSIVGLVMSIAQRKKGGGVGKIIYFIAFIILPIITVLVLIVLISMLANAN